MGLLGRVVRDLGRILTVFVAAVALLGACLVYARYVEPRWLRVRTVTLRAAPRICVIHISDLHYKGDAPFLRRIVATINGLKGDFVCFTGDLVEDHKYLAEALDILAGLNKPLYGVAGNHDDWARLSRAELEPGFARTGGAWLCTSNVVVALPGVELYNAKSIRRAARQDAPRAVLRILLVHRPSQASLAEGIGMDLILAGHTHGGQVRLPFVGRGILDGDGATYDRGLSKTPGGPLYVSPGIGTYYLPVRFLCRPEVTRIEL
jgi:uncharacterized protein